MRRDVFQAIADPSRRAILSLLAIGAMTPNAMAEHFDSSRQAISKHIKILTECGLIRIRPQGRERYCEASLRSLNKVSKWIDQYRAFWTHKLDALEIHLANEIKPIKKPRKKLRIKN